MKTIKQQLRSPAFWIGIVGMAMLQTNTIPQVIKILETGDASGLSVQMFVQTLIGLVCYLVNAISTRNLLYIISNTIGIVSVSITIIAILTLGG